MSYRQALDFTVDGDVRFLAHSDMLRLFARAVARAGLPVHHSAGFNPHPQISLPLPRSVGIASDAERIVIGYDDPLDPEEAMIRLVAQMPVGISLKCARPLAAEERCVPNRVAYRVCLFTDGEFHAVARRTQSSETVRERIQRLLAATEFVIERRSPKARAAKQINIRPYIDDLTAVGGDATPLELWMRLRVTAQGAAKPVEVCRALDINLDATQHLVRRLEVEWQ